MKASANLQFKDLNKKMTNDFKDQKYAQKNIIPHSKYYIL